MLKISEIYKIIRELDCLHVKCINSYDRFRKEVFINGTSVKYSAGGTVYPFGKYFFGKSQIYKKAARQSSGHFCKTLNEANFAYIYSDDGKLLSITEMFDASKNLDGYVDYTSFLVYNVEETYILKYNENHDKPLLHELGIIYLKSDCEIMVYSGLPCIDITIVIIDYATNREYLYSIVRELFETKYRLKSDEIYPDVWSIERKK